MDQLKISHYEKIESYLPVDLLTGGNFFKAFIVVYAFIIIRYALSVYPFYLYFWKINSQKKSYLHKGNFSKKQIQNEIYYSILSSLIFTLAGIIMGVLWQQGYTKIYLKIDTYSYLYLPLSFILISLLHEVYFYFTHRWMHLKSVFKHVHHIHHLSINTSPWASFSFHPFEAFILAAFLPLAVIILPIHPIILITYMMFMTLSAISNHLGVELIRSTAITRYFISGTHHALHHQYFKSNYGLYYCFMDRLFQTENTKREI
ncbi:MAG: sterol desaturase family protein [Pseudobdellovibrio sp.]